MNINKSASYTDELTGAFNRRYLNEMMRAEIQAYVDKTIGFSIAWVDIDRFKTVNDSYGHIKGDEVIKDFAKYLKQSLRIGDTVIRYGGDEFICVLPKIRKQDAERTWNRIIEKCHDIQFGGLPVSMSVGLSAFPDDSDDFDELLSIADDVLYDAKRCGRDRLGSLRKKRIEIPIKSFIDRGDEKERLRTVLSEAGNGIRIAIVKGAVGIGKTRLAKELLADFRNKEIIWSDCIALADSIAYYPIREIIKYRLERQGTEILATIPSVYKLEISKLVPEILVDVTPDTDSGAAMVDKYRLYESVRLLIDSGPKEKVIIIDNIQWIDPDSIEVLKYMFRSLQEKTIKCILIHRTEEETRGLQELIAFITRDFDAREITLACFPEKEIRECVKAIMGEDPSPELLNYVTAESGGNPFYIEQVMRELVDQDYLVLIQDRWCFKQPVTELVPKSVADIAMMKYQRLSSDGKRLLEIASILGKFDPDLIQRMTDYNTGHIIGLVGEVENLGLVKEVGANLEFQDALSRNAIYEHCITGLKRRMMHQQVANVLKDRYPEKEVLEELAYHYYRGKDCANGIMYCMKVGDRARELYSNFNAVKYYRWAQELMENDPRYDRTMLIDCLLKQADVHRFTGDFKNANDILNRAEELMRGIDDMTMKAKVFQQKASVDYYLSNYERSIENGEKSIEYYHHLSQELEIAKALLTTGSAKRRMGNYAEALNDFEQGHRIAKAHNDPLITMRADVNIGNVYMNMGEFESAFARYENALKIAETMADKGALANILGNMGGIYYKQGIYNEARWFFDKALHVAREIGSRDNEANTLNNLGSVYHSLGEYDKALATYREAIGINRMIGNKSHEALLLNNIGNIHRSKGEYDCARKFYEDSLRIAEQIKSSERIFSNLTSLGEVYIELGESAKARLMIDRAYGIAQNSRAMLLDVYHLSCQYYLLVGDHKKLAETIVFLEEIQRETQSGALEAEINVLYGQCYTANGEYEKADTHLQHALEIFKRLDHKTNIGVAYFHLGMMEIAAGKKGFAAKDLQRAIELFKKLGAKGWVQKVTDALSRLE